MSVKNKLMVIILILLCIMTSCSNKDQKTNENKSNKSVSITTSNLETLNTFYSSQDGIQALATGWRFTKAYFSADTDEMKKLLLSEKIEAYQRKNVFNNLIYFNLDWNFCNVMSDDEVFLHYSYELENESLAYFYVNLKKLDGEWKVSSYILE